MKAYAVVGSPNDLSEPVDSVWTNLDAAHSRCRELNESTLAPDKPHWHATEFELDTPNQDIN